MTTFLNLPGFHAVEVNATVLHDIMLRTWDISHTEHVMLSDLRITADQARSIANALLGAAVEQDLLTAAKAHNDSKPERTAPMTEVMDWFVADVSNRVTGWTHEEIVTQAEALAWRYVR